MSHSQKLAEFTSSLRYEDIPEEVVDRTLDLFLDWYGSCLAGSNSRQVQAISDFSNTMGPDTGASKIVGSDRCSSPYFASMINAAASHVVEQDDLHNTAIFHPATVVFPPALAVAQWKGNCTGKEFITAAVAGYEVGIRIGEYFGRGHYRIFHTTATAGTLASAMAVANLLQLNADQTLHALGSAGTQAAGLWEFLRDAADSKQLHTAKAASDGLLAAFTAQNGLTGARQILEGAQGLGAGMMADGDPSILSAGLGSRWGLLETSFKFHASCRHTHPAADAMLSICQQNQLDLSDISSVEVGVYQAAKDVLGAVVSPTTIHQSKFSMGWVLALIAHYGIAGVAEFTDDALNNTALRQFHDKVKMVVDADIEAAYPTKWCARVTVTMASGQQFSTYVDTPRGDPGNMLSRDELEQKAQMLVAHFGVCERDVMQQVIDTIWQLRQVGSINDSCL